jgi:hypothetical protein
MVVSSLLMAAGVRDVLDLSGLEVVHVDVNSI